MNVTWRSLYESSTDDLPPAPRGWSDDDALVFDRARQRLVYLRSADYHEHAEVWEMGDAGAWSKAHDALRVEVEQPWVGLWDEGRGGVACWTVRYAHEARRRMPVGLFVGADGVEEIADGGDAEVPEPRTLRDRSAIFGYDLARERTVMITPERVYSLDTSGRWEREYTFGAGEIAPQWRNASSSRAVWDHAGERLIVSVVDDEDDALRLYTYDGEAFAALTQEGLPPAEAFYDHWKAAGFALASSPTQGVVVVLGEPLGTWRLDEGGQRWSRVATSDEPMRPNDVEAAFDERDGSLWLGPGSYALSPGERTRGQHLMYRMSQGSWRVLGDLDRPSPTDDSRAVVAAHGGEMFVLKRRYDALTLSVAGSGRCRSLVDEAAAAQARAGLGFGDDAVVEAAAVDGEGRLHAFFQDGSVARWDGGAWARVCEASPKVFKAREEFVVGWDHGAGHFVAWGGKVNKRASPSTFYLLEAGWKKEKKSSPRPSVRRADGVEPRGNAGTWTLTYDPHEGAMVRVGFADVAVLRDGVWVAHVPQGYDVFHESFSPLPVYDVAREEVLLLDPWGRGIWRLDYGGLRQVGEMTYHEAMANPDRGTYDRVPRPLFRANCHAWDHAGGALMAQGEESASLQFALELGEVFEAARGLGARTTLAEALAAAEPAAADEEAAPAGSVRLYDPLKHRFWYGDVEGAEVRKREGNIVRHATVEDIKESRTSSRDAAKAQASLAKLAASRAKKGFVGAGELEEKHLEWYFAQELDVIAIGGPVDESDRWQWASFGGSPRGVTKSAWPRRADGAPMAHLFSVTSYVVGKARAISVFVRHDASAFEPGACVALPRTEAQLQRGPSTPPGEVPVIEALELTSDTHGTQELHEDKLAFFCGQDPAMAAAVAAWRPTVPTDDAVRSKVGGHPRWVGPPVWPVDADQQRYMFYAQLDLTALPERARAALEQAWPEADLDGVVYLFLSPDQKSAEAIWQRA